MVQLVLRPLFLLSATLILAVFCIHVGRVNAVNPEAQDATISATGDIVDGETETGDDCASTLEEIFSLESSERVSVLSTYVGLAMRKGSWNCAKQIVEMSQKHDIVTNDLKNSFEIEQRMIVKEIATLRTVIEGSLPMATVTPAFQWAQSASDLLLNVKFSHKIDAPSTLNCVVSNVTILPNQLVMIASDGRKNFKLDIQLLKTVIPEESRYDMASVGRMTFTLRKADAPSRWVRLLKNKEKKINQMHIWWEMQEKYRVELEKLDEDNSDKDEQAPVKSKKQKDTSGAEKGDRRQKTSTPEVDPDDLEDDISDSLMSTLKEIDTDAENEIKTLLEDGKKQKQAIDAKLKESKLELEAKAKLDKREIDAAILSKREAVENRAKVRKEQARATSSTTPPKLETS